MLKTRLGFLGLLLAGLLVACGGSPSRESTGEQIDDSVITAKIKTAFVQDKQVDAMDIKVDTFKGTVQLSGFADSQSEIDRAEQLSAEVAGVKAVRNDIRIKPQTP